MTDDARHETKRGRGRPRGLTEARWRIRAAILQALARARMEPWPSPTNAEIIAILEAQGGFKPGHIESATRMIRDERAALARHEHPHPTDPFAGFFDLPLAKEEELKTRDVRADAVRADKRCKATARRKRTAAKKPSG